MLIIAMSILTVLVCLDLMHQHLLKFGKISVMSVPAVTYVSVVVHFM